MMIMMESKANKELDGKRRKKKEEEGVLKNRKSINTNFICFEAGDFI